MTEDIKDIRVPVEFPLWGWIMLGVLLVLIIAGSYIWLKRRKKAPAEPLPAISSRPPAELALKALEELYQKGYPQLGQFKEFYICLSDIVRHYLEGQFGFKAPEMTTEEFLVFAQTSTLLTDDHKRSLRDFLNGCDMVKFAKHLPTVNEAQENFDLAKQLIMDTHHGI